MSIKAQGAEENCTQEHRASSVVKSGYLQTIFRSVLGAASPSFRRAEIVTSFYPYIGLTHTIRRKGQKWVVRISDHCRDAPGLVLEAIAAILACKILRRTAPASVVEAYTRFRQSPKVQARVRARRLEFGRKRIVIRQGKHHAIEEIYREINERYFGNRVQIERLGWGPRASWRRLGHYDPLHQTITLSPVLDSPKVPRRVVSYLLYHEMLHAVFADTAPKGKRRHHPPEFRRAEQAYPEYPSARKFLDTFCHTRGGEPD